MAIQLGSAYGKIALDVGGFLKGITKSKEGMLLLLEAGQNLGEGMKNVGRNLTLGLTLPIAALGAASVKAASDFEETKNKAVVVFGEMSDSVVANANKAATALGISKTQYLDYASSIGAALTAGGMGIKESTDLAEQAVKHFADLASFHNARVEDVAAAWQSAIRGQYEPIQKFFPFITDSYLKTYGVANGLVEENTSKLTANQRAIILNAIALDSKLNPAIDDFSETSSGLANSSRILKAQLQDALVLLGQNLLPLVLILVSALNKLLTAFNNLPPGVQKLVVVLLALLALAGPVLSFIGTLVSLGSTIGGVVTTLSGLGVTLPAIGAGLAALAPAAGAVVVALLPILAILAGLLLWVGVVYLAWKYNFLGMRDHINALIAKVRAVWDVLMKIRDGVVLLYEDGSGALLDLAEAFGFPSEAAQEFLSNIWLAMNKLREIFARAREFIVNAFTTTDWSQLGKFIVYGIANGLLFGIPGLILAATKAVQAVLNTFDTQLDAHSPSKKLEQRGIWSGQGYIAGLMKSLQPDAISDTLAKPLSNNNTQQQTIIQNFSSGLTTQQVRGMIAENNEQLVNSIVGALGGA